MRRILSIAERELRSRARRPLTQWLRTGLAAGGAALVAATINNWTANGSQPSNLAFHYLAWVVFFVAVSSAFATMDIICRERREGTLGLLFLTPLSGPDVVLGKFATSAFVGILIIAGFTPVLVVALLPGGVTGMEVLRVVLILLETLLVGLAMGVCVSATARDLLSATRLTVLRMLALLLLPLLANAFWFPVPFRNLALLSPITAFDLSHGSGYQLSPARFWISAGILLVEATGLLLLTSKLLARNWREDFRESKRPTPSSEAPIHRPAVPMGDKQPIPWLVHRQRRQPALFWIAAVLMSFVGSFGLFFHFVSSVAGPAVGTAALMNVFTSAFAEAGSATAIAMFALAAGRFFMEARSNGTLELLLTTPIGVRDLVGGQKQALLRLLAGPLVVILLPAGATLLILVCFREAMSDQLAPWYAANLVLYAIKQTLNVLTACTVGLWFGLHCRNAWTLMAWAAGLTAGLQWLTTLALYAIYLLVRPDMDLGTMQVPLIWKFWEVVSPAAQLIPAFILILWANHRIRQDLAGIAEAVSPWEDLRVWLRNELGKIAMLLGLARHWTPSGSTR